MMNKTNAAVAKLIAMHEEMKRKKYPNVPEHCRPKSKFDTNSANGLTKAILTWLELKGHYCSRIQSQGQWNPKLGIFTKGTTKKGIGDIMAIIKACHVMIEVKYGKDRLSPAQIKTKQDVERSGGVYVVIKDFEQWVQFYEDFTNTELIVK